MRHEYLGSRPDPIPELKRQLGHVLAELLSGWNADDIAASIGTDRPRISELRRGKLKRFSLETLIRYVDRLNNRVDIVVTREPRNFRGKLPAGVPRAPVRPSSAAGEATGS